MRRKLLINTMPRNQSGAVLVVGLVILLVMTLLAVASMGSMTTELKVAANLQNQNTAFQAATANIEAIKADETIDWVDDASGKVGVAIATQPTLYEISNGEDVLAQSTARIVFSGCKSVVSGESLTSEGGSQFLVHEIQTMGEALDSSGNVIAKSNQVIGLITTKVASCG